MKREVVLFAPPSVSYSVDRTSEPKGLEIIDCSMQV